MAALVQKTAQFFLDGVTGGARSITGVTAGNLVVCTVALCSQPNTPSTTPAIVTPSGGWSVGIAPSGNNSANSYRPICAIFYKANAGAGTHTATWNSGDFPTDTYAEVTLEEFSGCDTSAPLDVTASGLGDGVTSGNTGTTASSSALGGVAVVVGSLGGQGSSFSAPPATGYTAIDSEPDPNTHFTYGSGYKILSGAATQTASWTWTGSSLFVGVIATFKNASGASDHPIDGAGQIASAEAFGSPAISASVAAAGIASAEAFGSAVVAAGVAAAGIATAEALGAPALGASIVAAGIASAEAFGQPIVNGAGVFAAGIPSAEAFGQPSLSAGLQAAGITSAEAFGLPTVGAPTVASAPSPSGASGSVKIPRGWPYEQAPISSRERKRLKRAEEWAREQEAITERLLARPIARVSPPAPAPKPAPVLKSAPGAHLDSPAPRAPAVEPRMTPRRIALERAIDEALSQAPEAPRIAIQQREAERIRARRRSEEEWISRAAILLLQD